MLDLKFNNSAIIFTDNAGFHTIKPFLKYLRNTPEKYNSITLKTKKGLTE
jgi:hypothetical protein